MYIGYGCSPGLFPDIYWACARTCPFLHLPSSSLLIRRVDGGYWGVAKSRQISPLFGLTMSWWYGQRGSLACASPFRARLPPERTHYYRATRLISSQKKRDRESERRQTERWRKRERETSGYLKEKWTDICIYCRISFYKRISYWLKATWMFTRSLTWSEDSE